MDEMKLRQYACGDLFVMEKKKFYLKHCLLFAMSVTFEAQCVIVDLTVTFMSLKLIKLFIIFTLFLCYFPQSDFVPPPPVLHFIYSQLQQTICSHSSLVCCCTSCRQIFCFVFCLINLKFKAGYLCLNEPQSLC